jgi:4-alpha-glucanotransferase
MQDWLGLGAEARMNTPGLPEGNWAWRVAPGSLDLDLASRIVSLTRAHGR